MILLPDDTPEKAVLKVKKHIQQAAAGDNHPMRFFTVSSITPETNTVSSRMVVFRKFRSDWTVRFYTDHRTKKVADIQQSPNVSLLFWDSSKKIQIRFKAEATIHNCDEIANNEWRNVNENSRREYTSLLKPGASISDPEDVRYRPEILHDEFFSVVDCTPFDLQVLQLNKTEHLALKFHRNDSNSKWKGGWIVP